MQARAIIILVIAVVLGIAAVWLINTQFDAPQRQVAETTTIKTQPVVVVTEDIPVGEELQRITLKTVSWPSESIPEGSYASVDEVMEGDTAPTLVKEIRKGEPVLPYKIAGKGEKRGLTAKIEPGMRAITITVNEVRGVAGFVLPGNRVDVLHTTTAGRARDDKVTRILEQNMLVLGVDQEASEEKDDPQVVNAVTLLASPKQAQRLTLAESVGQLNLVLRNEGDTKTPHPDVIATYNLTTPPAHPQRRVVRSGSAPKKKTRQPSSKHQVELIRGLEVNKETVSELPEDANKGKATGDRKDD